MAAVTELDAKLGLIGLLDGEVASIKERDRGLSAGQWLMALACAHLAGEDHQEKRLS